MDALSITFNPIVDRMFIIVLALLIFVLGTTAVVWIMAEVRNFWNWIRKTPKPVEKTDQPNILYEVQWSLVENFEIAQTRIASSPELAVIALLQENLEGYIRYRPFDGQREWAWGIPLWREAPIQHYGLDTGILFDPVPDWTQIKSEYQNQLVDPVIDDTEPPKTTYIFEWANNPEFSTTISGGIVDRYITKDPDTKVKEIIDSLGSGYIRYRLANDTTDSWIPNGYVTKETLNNA